MFYTIYVALFIYFTVVFVFGLLLVIRFLFLFNHGLLVFSELEFCFIQTSNSFFDIDTGDKNYEISMVPKIDIMKTLFIVKITIVAVK